MLESISERVDHGFRFVRRRRILPVGPVQKGILSNLIYLTGERVNPPEADSTQGSWLLFGDGFWMIWVN
jgi:hypothetical protein